jgi:hypothetical protein
MTLSSLIAKTVELANEPKLNNNEKIKKKNLLIFKINI